MREGRAESHNAERPEPHLPPQINESSAFSRDSARDIETIIITEDIAIEQEMAARLQRAEWLIRTGVPAHALPDLDAVLASYRNFEGVEERARSFIAETHAQRGDGLNG